METTASIIERLKGRFEVEYAGPMSEYTVPPKDHSQCGAECQGMLVIDADGYECVEPCPSGRMARRTARMQAAFGSLFDLALDYKALPHRRALDAKATSWRTGLRASRPFFYICGTFGTGKSVAACRLAMRLYLEDGIQGVHYVIEHDFCAAASERWSDDATVKELANRQIQRCAEAELLVFDELHRKGRYSDAQEREMDRLFHNRMRQGAATIICSNEAAHMLGPLGWLSPALASRMHELAVVVELQATDLRRQ